MKGDLLQAEVYSTKSKFKIHRIMLVTNDAGYNNINIELGKEVRKMKLEIGSGIYFVLFKIVGA